VHREGVERKEESFPGWASEGGDERTPRALNTLRRAGAYFFLAVLVWKPFCRVNSTAMVELAFVGEVMILNYSAEALANRCPYAVAGI
jgi:hypothetical protein